MAPRIKEKKEANKWTGQETSRLIASIKAQLKKHDPLPYSRRISALNWENVSIPNKSVKECKGHLDVVIKKIHRTRTLAEILSDVSVEPLDVISEQIIEKPIDNNNNSPATHCFKRKSERLSEVNERKCLEKHVLQPSNLNHNDAKHSSEDSLKDQGDEQAEDAQLFWTRKTDEELNFGHEGKRTVPGKENHSLRKRKSEANDYANQSSNKKVRKTPVKIEYSTVEKTEKRIQINVKSTAQELMDINGNIGVANAIDQICGSCVSDIEMENSDPESSLVTNEGDELPQDLFTEPTGIASPNMETEPTGIASLDLMSDAKEVAQLPRMNKKIKQEVPETTICTGLFVRLGSWMVKQE